MRYQFADVKLTNIEGKEVKDSKIHQTLANALYSFSKDVALANAAMKMYKGESVELDKVEIEEVKRLINDDRVGLYTFAKAALLNYIQDVQDKKVKVEK